MSIELFFGCALTPFVAASSVEGDLTGDFLLID
jgi:hypothetical protein